MLSIPRTGDAVDHATSSKTRVLAIKGLDVRFATSAGEIHAVRDISLDVRRGETVAIVGESGSGKSQAMLAAFGLLAGNGRATGSVQFDGQEILGAPRDTWNRLRGTRMAMIFQEPMTSLDPLVRIGDQIAAPLLTHSGMTRTEAHARALELLREVEIHDPGSRIAAYPHELSGGQRQRVMIAMALANTPSLLIADEPTTALDVTVQAHILSLLAGLKQRHGLAMVFITHDLGLVGRLADRVVVMHAGRVVEAGASQSILGDPQHACTRALLSAVPSGRKQPPAADARQILEAQGLRVVFKGAARGFGWRRGGDTVAVDGVDISVRAGETVGVVGESGSGKSTLGRAVLRLVPASGRIALEDRDLMPLGRAELRPLRRHMQVVFQDPFGALSPRMTTGEIATEGLLVHEPRLNAAERDRRATKAFEEMQLDPILRHRFPHELSGGQRQRVAIARAMMLRPRLVVLDEPTSALDRTVGVGIVNLLRKLQAVHGLAYVFISHDLRMIEAMSDRIMVMRAGRIVETAPTEKLLRSPREPYTRELLAAAYLDEA